MSPWLRFIRRDWSFKPVDQDVEVWGTWTSNPWFLTSQERLWLSQERGPFYTQQQSLVTFAHLEIGPAIRRAYPILPWRQGERLQSEICDFTYFWSVSLGWVIMVNIPSKQRYTVMILSPLAICLTPSSSRHRAFVQLCMRLILIGLFPSCCLPHYFWALCSLLIH